MYKGYSVLCVIPARGGSKGLKAKNIRRLLNKPLIAYTIDHAKKCGHIDRVIVSTENDRIARVAEEWGADVPYRRPARLARDSSGTIDVLVHVLDWIKKNEGRTYDIVVLLHATTPLRNVADVRRSIEKLVNEKADNVFSVTSANRNPYFNMVEIDNRGRVSLVKEGCYKTRQAAPIVFDMNASVYVWWAQSLKGKKGLFFPKTVLHIMPKDRSVDIDDAIDFSTAEMLLRRGRGR
jgi:CMP-N,N'-diacetyllegionaminic acid synthase